MVQCNQCESFAMGKKVAPSNKFDIGILVNYDEQ